MQTESNNQPHTVIPAQSNLYTPGVVSAPGGGGARVAMGAGALDTGAAAANKAGGCDTGVGAGGPAGRAIGAAAAGTPGKGDGPVLTDGPGGPREAFTGPAALAGLIVAGAAGIPPCDIKCNGCN